MFYTNPGRFCGVFEKVVTEVAVRSVTIGNESKFKREFTRMSLHEKRVAVAVVGFCWVVCTCHHSFITKISQKYWFENTLLCTFSLKKETYSFGFVLHSVFFFFSLFSLSCYILFLMVESRKKRLYVFCHELLGESVSRMR